MSTSTICKAIEPIDMMGLKWKLECAVVSAWKELSTHNVPAQMQIAYETGADGRVDHLKIWSSLKRGEWDLVCDYWMMEDGAHCGGMLFSRGFSSPELESSLDSIMKHQDKFPLLLRTSYGLIQIQEPTADGLRIAQDALLRPYDAALMTVESSTTQ